MTMASMRGAGSAALDDAVRAAAAGDPVLIRAAEGAALVRAAGAVTPAELDVVLARGDGVLRAPISSARADRFGLPPLVVEGTRGHPVPVEAGDAANTLRVLVASTLGIEFHRPGRVFPVRVDDGAVLHRAGLPEAAVELLGLAGLPPVGALVAYSAGSPGDCEGPVVTAEELAERRYRAECRPVTRTRLPTRHGEFEAVGYSEPRSGGMMLALVGSGASCGDRVSVRVHHACVIGDTFGSAACDCAGELEEALSALASGECEALLYLPAEHGHRPALLHTVGLAAQQTEAEQRWLALAVEAMLDDLGLVRDTALL